MKYFSHILIASLLGFSFAACSEKTEPYGESLVSNAKLSVNPQTLTFNLERIATVKVEASENLEWYTEQSYDSWVNVKKSWGYGTESVDVTVEEDNPSENVRRETVYFNSNRFFKTAALTVEQAGTSVKFDAEQVVFPPVGGTEAVNVVANASWEVSSCPTWLTVTPQKGSPGTTLLTLSATRNTYSTEQNATLKLRNPDYKITVGKASLRVLQTEVQLTVPSNVTFERPDADSKTVSVTSNSSWTARSSENWCTVTPSSGDNNGTLTISVIRNTGSWERQAYVEVSSGNVRRTINIIQYGTPENSNVGLDEYGTDTNLGTVDDSNVSRDEYESDQNLNNK